MDQTLIFVQFDYSPAKWMFFGDILESAYLSVCVAIRLCVYVSVCVPNTTFCQSAGGVSSHIQWQL